jgi:cytoskeletal protein CcmA (bactofilin family)
MAFWGNQDDKKKNVFPANEGVVAPFSTVKNEASTTSAFPTSGVASPVSLVAEDRVRSALGPGTVIQGKLSFDAPVSIDGKLSGEISSSKTLIVGKSGIIDAQVEVATLIIRGTVKGTIKATERIEIRDGGQLIGDIITPSLIMDDGCIFNGTCHMTSNSALKKAVG